jgi:hypothetical protein
MRRSLFPAVLLATAAISLRSAELRAQEPGARIGPQFVSYTLGAPSNVTITETAIPVFAYMPIGTGITIDIGTAFAMANVKSTVSGQTRESRISGPTDTQIRATMNLGSDNVLLTAGLNIPTGKATADTSEQMAAALIGNDFLVFPISSMGSGFGGTGGLAFAKPVGMWNLGAGVSVRTSMPFDPYIDNSGNKLRYTPGTEMRARVGLDHPYGTGRASVGLTYSKFGDDQFQTSIYNTGDRLLSQGSLSNSIWAGDYLLSAWNLFRSSGTLADGSPTGAESITDLSAAWGRQMGSGRLEPGVGFRTWMQADIPTSLQSTVSMRYEWTSGRMTLSPMAGFTFGSIGATATESASLSGFRAQLTLRML